jgi:hypothetical protein
LNQIAWDFTADEYELSFQIAEMPSDYDELRLIATDLSTMTHAALLKVNRGTVSLEVTAPGTARGVIRAFRNVSVGDRVGIRYLSDGVYRLTHNGSVVSSASISRSEVLSVIGSVTAANPETCTVQAYTGTAGPLWGWVATAGVAADGSFALGALAGQQIRVQVHCPDWPSPNWYGGVTPDDHLDATVNTITDPVTDLGTIGAP